MKAIILKNKKGEIVDNDEIVYFTIDEDKKFPIRRVVRFALINTNRIMSKDCSGMEGEGGWGIDTYWDYFKEFYPSLVNEIPSDNEFEQILIDKFYL